MCNDSLALSSLLVPSRSSYFTLSDSLRQLVHGHRAAENMIFSAAKNGLKKLTKEKVEDA